MRAVASLMQGKERAGHEGMIGEAGLSALWLFVADCTTVVTKYRL